MGIRGMSLLPCFIIISGVVIGKREGTGWKWPGSTSCPFSEFPGQVGNSQTWSQLRDLGLPN